LYGGKLELVEVKLLLNCLNIMCIKYFLKNLKKGIDKRFIVCYTIFRVKGKDLLKIVKIIFKNFKKVLDKGFDVWYNGFRFKNKK
jgi:hypothetical protein